MLFHHPPAFQLKQPAIDFVAVVFFFLHYKQIRVYIFNKKPLHSSVFTFILFALL